MKDILVALCILVLGIWLFFSAFGDYRSHARLETEGIDVVSEPLDKYTEKTKGGVTIGYDIAPNFQTKSGGNHSCYGSVDKEIIDHLKGMPIIKVRYLPSDPSVCSIEGAKKGDLWFVILLGLGMMIGSVLFMYNKSTAR
ncbi:MAG: hypothetical protein KGO49_05325 [Gammaproteobacteria bacterium]|nr:hypothetical protein [Gammaproteobacteria bacterium]